jgi:hypothetical protein
MNKIYLEKVKAMEDDFTLKLEAFANQTKFDLENEPIIIEKMKDLESDFQLKHENLTKQLDDLFNNKILENEKQLINKYENLYL